MPMPGALPSQPPVAEQTPRRRATFPTVLDVTGVPSEDSVDQMQVPPRTHHLLSTATSSAGDGSFDEVEEMTRIINDQDRLLARQPPPPPQVPSHTPPPIEAPSGGPQALPVM
ncbi:hypothetical protein FRC06_011749, partial [Ceratobasidium sp. 370]